MRSPAIAVAVHDVEPATFERCALIRDWLDDHGIEKVTLLVIPASDLHPFADRRPELAEWLVERVGLGDTVAQHGFHHRRLGRPAAPGRRLMPGGSVRAEFTGLDDAEARRAVEAGRRVLRLAGIEARGFVAPDYAYTTPLRRVLAASFDWWAGLRTLRFERGARVTHAQALRIGAAPGLTRLSAPLGVRASARMAGPLLRLDLHPGDLDHPGRIGAVESVLRHARHRTALTYDDLALRPG